MARFNPRATSAACALLRLIVSGRHVSAKIGIRSRPTSVQRLQNQVRDREGWLGNASFLTSVGRLRDEPEAATATKFSVSEIAEARGAAEEVTRR
jgi:hypothetical protein